MNFKLILISLIYIIILASPVYASHYIVGYANDAEDLTSANGRTIILWNPSNGISDNVTDIIGTSGNSGSNNIYLIDCELLNTPCKVGNQITVKILDSGDGYISEEVSKIVSGSGFDLMSNITLVSSIIFSNLSVDDSFSTPVKELDLTPNSTTLVNCSGILTGTNLDSTINNVTARLFNYPNASYNSNDDNNNHYTNNSCFMNLSYGNPSEVSFGCFFNIEYYSNSGNWNCTISATKSQNLTNTGTTNTNVNTLLALGLPNNINYGTVNATAVSDEQIANVTNFGNVPINLTLGGYARTPGDNLSMNCSVGYLRNISIGYEKYNLTSSTAGSLNITSFQGNYTNLTAASIVRKFNLNYRYNDTFNEAIKSTYWRIYVPQGSSGSCSGNIVFGASALAGT